ncbi:hypothetical protein LTS08_005735 [Lithohypha guttulata]|nr:hypothetical protein LTS08_005735 [Lithohypha guttulata]
MIQNRTQVKLANVPIELPLDAVLGNNQDTFAWGLQNFSSTMKIIQAAVNVGKFLLSADLEVKTGGGAEVHYQRAEIDLNVHSNRQRYRRNDISSRNIVSGRVCYCLCPRSTGYRCIQQRLWAASYSNLARALSQQDKYKEAENLHRQALQARKQVLGPEHPDTLRNIDDLAGVLSQQGKHDEAQRLYSISG